MKYDNISDNLTKITRDDGSIIYQITIHTSEEGRANCLPFYGYSWMTLKPAEIDKIAQDYIHSTKTASFHKENTSEGKE